MKKTRIKTIIALSTITSIFALASTNNVSATSQTDEFQADVFEQDAELNSMLQDYMLQENILEEGESKDDTSTFNDNLFESLLEGSLLYINDGQISSAPKHILEGYIKISNVSESTNLNFEIITEDGQVIDVATLPVSQDGIYNISEIIDTTDLPEGEVLINVLADTESINDENLEAEVSIRSYDENELSNGTQGSLGIGGGIYTTSKSTGNGMFKTGGLIDPYNPTIDGSLFDTGDSGFLTETQESSELSTLTTTGTDEIEYDNNSMVIGFNTKSLSRDEEGSVNSFTNPDTDEELEASRLQELKELYGEKTAEQWSTFDWQSSITQSALDYLLAVHKNEITGVSITSVESKLIRQTLLEGFSYATRELINGCLSGYDLDFSTVDLQYCDWRGRLSDLTGTMLLQAAKSVLNVNGNYAGLQGSCYPEVIFSGTENYTNVSLACTYTGSFVGITLSQILQVDATGLGTVGLIMSEAQGQSWSSSIGGNWPVGITMNWNGYDYWEFVFEQVWTYLGYFQPCPIDSIICEY